MDHAQVEWQIGKICNQAQRKLRVAEADTLHRRPKRIAELRSDVEALKFVRDLLASSRPIELRYYKPTDYVNTYYCRRCRYRWTTVTDVARDSDWCPCCTDPTPAQSSVREEEPIH